MSCPVCFGGDDLAIRESLNAGIGVLLGVTAVVLGGFARFIVRLARRSREYSHLVDVSSVRLQPDDYGVQLPAFAEGFGEAGQSALGARRPQPDQGNT